MDIRNKSKLLVLVFLTLTIFSVIHSSNSELSSSEFFVAKRFPTNTCRTESQSHLRSNLMCASKCGQDNSCTGYKWNASNHTCTFILEDCFTETTCPGSDSLWAVYRKKQDCHNDGLWSVGQQSCHCSGSWTGTFCEVRLYHNCSELLAVYPAGTYKVTLDIYGNKSWLVQASCRVTTERSQVLTYIFSTDGWQDHNRTWEEYRWGYAIDSNNFWLGLETMAVFSQRGLQDVLLTVNLWVNGQHKRWVHTYSNFFIQQDSRNFTLTSGGYAEQTLPTYTDQDQSQNKIGNILSNSNSVSFSTYDRNNVKSGGQTGQNCARLAGAGWWYADQNCDLTLNLLGWNYQRKPGDFSLDHVIIPNLNMSNPGITNVSISMYYQTQTQAYTTFPYVTDPSNYMYVF